MTARQAEKEAHKVAFEFEEQMMQGYSMNDNVRFQDYAQYVLDLKRDSGLKIGGCILILFSNSAHEVVDNEKKV